MFALNNVIRNNVNNAIIKTLLRRYLSTVYEKEFTVTPFCNVNIKLPFNVNIIPLDVHKYQNYDKVIIKLNSKETNSKIHLQCNSEKDIVNISSDTAELIQDVTCNIEAPIKANINVAAKYGSVNLSNFNGESITLSTEGGNIFASKCHCDKISITSSSGNIKCTNVMQAATIYLKTGKRGSISTGRLQGLKLVVETENGDVQTESSYCDNSSFRTASGCLDLRSAHKNCKVIITSKGILNMTGFDGTLLAEIKEGDAAIQIARIDDNSKIQIDGNGTLWLKLYGTCATNTRFKVTAKDVQIKDDINIKATSVDGLTILNSHSQASADVIIDCPKSSVIVKGASLSELFNLKLPT